MKNVDIAAHTQELALALRQCDAYIRYANAREAAFAFPYMKAFYMEYRRLQTQVQASAVAGARKEELERQLQCLSESLHFDSLTSELLLAEYCLNSQLEEILRALARAVEIDLGFLEE